MKYCKRCFRNITEDVMVCPYCGKTDKLIDYDKEKRGEDFSCNDDSTFTSHIKSGDAYDTEESGEDADTAYGNTKHHNIDDCENSAEAPERADPGTPGENFSRSFTYLRSLPPAVRAGIIKNTADDIEKRFGYNPDESATININGREITVSQFNRLKDFFDKSDQLPEKTNINKNQALTTGIVIWLIVTILAPPVGIFLGIAAAALYTKSQKNKNNDQH